ncbi:MAG TPA: hypothetical protein VH518_22265 [Tepidisphaeraceae bacterium]
MTQASRSCRCGPVLAAGAILLTAGLAGCVTVGAPQQIADLKVGKDYEGAVQNIAFDAAGVPWLATRSTLYHVQGGTPGVQDSTREKYDWIALAPRGGVYARLHAISGGLYTIELYETSTKPIAELRLTGSPIGFSGIYLGGAGDLIVTVKALDSREALGGRFQYVFWSKSGQFLSQVTLDGPRMIVMDVNGEALLFLGRKDALAFDKQGKQLWKLDGWFRNAALGEHGNTALLDPQADNVMQQVHIFRGGKSTTVTMQSPIHSLALTADGSTGAVAAKDEVFFISPKKCGSSSCRPRAAPALPVAGTFLVTEIRFVNEKLLAVGVIQRVGDKEPHTFPAGAVLVLKASSRVVNTSSPAVLFNQRIELEQPATWAPILDVSYGARSFAAHTPHRAIIVSVAP